MDQRAFAGFSFVNPRLEHMISKWKKQNGSPVSMLLALHFEIDCYPIPFIVIWSNFNWMDNKNIKDLGLTVTSIKGWTKNKNRMFVDI